MSYLMTFSSHKVTEIADINELLNTHGDLFEEDIDADDIDIEMTNISELLHRNLNIFEVSDLTIWIP